MSVREDLNVVSSIKELRKKHPDMRLKDFYVEVQKKYPTLTFNDLMSILFKKPKVDFLKQQGLGVQATPSKGKPRKQYPSARISVHPAVLLIYNHLVERGYEGDLSEFLNANILKNFGLEPLLAIEADQDIMQLKKRITQLQLQREVAKLEGREKSLDEEIDQLLDWYSTIKVMESVGE